VPAVYKVRLLDSQLDRVELLLVGYAYHHPGSPRPTIRLLTLLGLQKGLRELEQRLKKNGGLPPDRAHEDDRLNDRRKVETDSSLVTFSRGLLASLHERRPDRPYPSVQTVMTLAMQIGLSELEASYLTPQHRKAS